MNVAGSPAIQLSLLFPTFLALVLVFLLFLQNTYFFLPFPTFLFQNAANFCKSVHIICVR